MKPTVGRYLSVRTQSHDSAEPQTVTRIRSRVQTVDPPGLVRIPEDYIKRQAVCPFVSGVMDRELKQPLLVDGEGPIVKPLTRP